jgi:hypothetical protein
VSKRLEFAGRTHEQIIRCDGVPHVRRSMGRAWRRQKLPLTSTARITITGGGESVGPTAFFSKNHRRPRTATRHSSSRTGECELHAFWAGRRAAAMLLSMRRNPSLLGLLS